MKRYIIFALRALFMIGCIFVNTKISVVHAAANSGVSSTDTSAASQTNESTASSTDASPTPPANTSITPSTAPAANASAAPAADASAQKADKKKDKKADKKSKDQGDSGKAAGKNKNKDEKKGGADKTGAAAPVAVNAPVTSATNATSQPSAIMYQPPVVQVVKGSVASATLNGVDVTADAQKLVVYRLVLDQSKYKGSKNSFNSIFEGDPQPGAKKELAYVLLFADGSRVYASQEEKNKPITSSYYTQPFQVLEARYGSPAGKKNKNPGYIDVTRYLQDNIYAGFSPNIIKTEQDPAKAAALKALHTSLLKEQVNVVLNGVPFVQKQAWAVKTTLRAPGFPATGSLKTPPAWTVQDWGNRVPKKVLAHPDVTITKANKGSYQKAELSNRADLPSVLQAVKNENKTADPNAKKGKGKKSDGDTENDNAKSSAPAA